MDRQLVVKDKTYSEDDLKKATLDNIIKICKELKMSFPEYGHLLYKRNALIEKMFQATSFNSSDVDNEEIANESYNYEDRESEKNGEIDEDNTIEKIALPEEKSPLSIDELFKRSFGKDSDCDIENPFIENKEDEIVEDEKQVEVEFPFEDGIVQVENKIVEDVPEEGKGRRYTFEDLKQLDYRSLADICSDLKLIEEEADDSYYGYDRSELTIMILDFQGEVYNEIEIRKYYDEYYIESKEETSLEEVGVGEGTNLPLKHNYMDYSSFNNGYDGVLYVNFTSTSILLKVEVKKEDKVIYYDIPSLVYVDNISLDEVDVLFGEDLQNALSNKLLKGTFIDNLGKWLQEDGNGEETRNSNDKIITSEKKKILKAFFNKLVDKIGNDLSTTISSICILTENNSIIKETLGEHSTEYELLYPLELDGISAIIYELSTIDKKIGITKYLGVNLEENKCELIEYTKDMKEGEFSYILTIDKKILEQSFALSINKLIEKIAYYIKHKLIAPEEDNYLLFSNCEKIFRELDNNKPLEQINKELGLYYEKADLSFPTNYNQLELGEDYYKIRNNHYGLQLAVLNILNGNDGNMKLNLYKRENQGLLGYKKVVTIRNEEIKRVIAGEMYLGIKSLLHSYKEEVVLVGEKFLVQTLREVIKELIPGNMVKSFSGYDCIKAADRYSQEVIKGTIETVVTNHRENIKYVVSTRNFKGEEIILIDEVKNINYVTKSMMANEVEFYLKSGCDNLEVVNNYTFINKGYVRKEEISLEKYIEIFGVENVCNKSTNTNRFVVKLNDSRSELFVLLVQNRDNVEYIGDLKIFNITEK